MQHLSVHAHQRNSICRSCIIMSPIVRVMN